jgi:hypothetical protein
MPFSSDLHLLLLSTCKPSKRLARAGLNKLQPLGLLANVLSRATLNRASLYFGFSTVPRVEFLTS